MGWGALRALACPWSGLAWPCCHLIQWARPVASPVCMVAFQTDSVCLVQALGSPSRPRLQVESTTRPSASSQAKEKKELLLWPHARARGQDSILASVSTPDQSVGSSVILSTSCFALCEITGYWLKFTMIGGPSPFTGQILKSRLNRAT